MMVFGFLGLLVGFLAWLIPVILLGVIAGRLRLILHRTPETGTIADAAARAAGAPTPAGRFAEGGQGAAVTVGPGTGVPPRDPPLIRPWLLVALAATVILWLLV